jgi:hypothetical protein
MNIPIPATESAKFTAELCKNIFTRDIITSPISPIIKNDPAEVRSLLVE